MENSNLENATIKTRWVCVAGTRNYVNETEFRIELDKQLKDMENIGIMSGGAKGTDEMAKRYAKNKNLPYMELPANWEQHGRAAGPIRNEAMARLATAVICFWDGESRGTLDMLTKARKFKVPYIWTFLYKHGARVIESI